jgi:membrane protein YqaA with SNARE-associated domain
VGAFVSLLTGAFPFPRKGNAGLERAERLLERGRNVLLFPEGTRSVDGTVGDFHCGVGKLALRGFPIIPVGISGTRAVLPRGARLPRQGRVAITIGEPRRFTGESPVAIAEVLREEIVSLMESAAPSGEPRAPSAYARARRFALSRGALVAVFLWATAEAVLWPIVPDFVLLPLAIAAPARAVKLIGAALLGTLLGGLVAYSAGGTALGGHVLAHAPLVTDRMIAFAGSSLAENGPSVLLGQPWSGVPYKVFAYQAAPVEVGPFMIMSSLGRGARFLAFGLSGAALGKITRPVWQRAFGPLCALYAVGFGVGLWRVVLSWA